MGVDVLSNETALVAGAVRIANNVDIGRAGQFKRRKGYTQRAGRAGLHSLYYAAQRGWTVVARDAELCRLDTRTHELAPLTLLNSAHPLWYTEYNGNLYFSNQTTLGWIPADSDTPRRVGLVTPPAPVLTEAEGGLLPGTYGVVITMVNDRGEESGASNLGTIQLPEGGGIRLSGLPQSAVHTVYVYITSADGDILRFAAEFPAVFPSYVVAESAQGAQCDTLFLTPLPPGEFVCWHNGRLLTAKDNHVVFSQALRPHLHNPAHNFIPFSGRISLLESNGEGVFVGDERGVWFLAGKDPSRFELRRVSSCRAVRRSSVMVPPEHLPEKPFSELSAPVPVWLSTSGYVVGMPNGEVVELHPDRIKVPNGLVGRSAFLLREGRKQVVTPVNSTLTATFGNAVDSVIS